MTGALESRLRFYATGVADMRNAEAGMFLAIREAEGWLRGGRALGARRNSEGASALEEVYDHWGELR